MPKASVNGATLHYHVHGRGTPIVFIHPPLLNRAVFRYQEVQLADPLQVITFDIRGHGFSPASEAPVTYELITEDIKTLLDYLNIRKAYLCGYSAGAGAAIHTMLTHPDRISGAVLVGAMAEPNRLAVRTQLSAASAMAKLGMKTSLALLVAGMNADMRETFHNLYYEAIRGDVRNWQQYFDASMKFNPMERLGRVEAPTLLVYGSRDGRFEDHAKALHERLPASTTALIPDVKHYMPTKGAGSFNDLVTKWVLKQELLAAQQGEAHVDKDLLRRAMEYDLRISDELLADHGLMQ